MGQDSWRWRRSHGAREEDAGHEIARAAAREAPPHGAARRARSRRNTYEDSGRTKCQASFSVDERA